MFLDQYSYLLFHLFEAYILVIARANLIHDRRF